MLQEKCARVRNRVEEKCTTLVHMESLAINVQLAYVVLLHYPFVSGGRGWKESSATEKDGLFTAVSVSRC